VPLFDYTLYPVCSPQLAAKLGPSPTPAAILERPLVEIYSEPRHWDVWCEAAQLVYQARPALVVDTLAVALEFALAGRAIALVNGPFIDDDLAAGRLVRVGNHQVTCPGAWGLICRAETQETSRVRTFMDWIVSGLPNKPATA
jgi:LysR family glycine cleavage system transcriptional activator